MIPEHAIPPDLKEFSNGCSGSIKTGLIENLTNNPSTPKISTMPASSGPTPGLTFPSPTHQKPLSTASKGWGLVHPFRCH